MKVHSFRWWLLLTCLLSLHNAALFSQEDRGTILGQILDGSGAAIPGAAIRVTNLDTGIVNTSKTETTGNYTIPFLPPGRYSVSVEAAGFARAENPGINLHAQENVLLDFGLKTGTLKETIQVTATAPLLQAATTTTGQTVDAQIITELPMLDRNLATLTLLGTGTSLNSNLIAEILSGILTGGVATSANGIRDSANQYTIDGSNVNIGFYNYPSFVPVPDAVQELSVQTGNYSAEYGQFAGAHIDSVLKSGTNSFHGGVWDYLRNDALDSRNTFVNSVTPLKQNQFGVLVGGPIRKNKTFFMGTYQGLRTGGSTIMTGIVPTPAQRTGDLSLNWDGTPMPDCSGCPAGVPFLDPTTGTPFSPPTQIPTISTQAKAILNLLYPTPNVSHQPGFNWQSAIPTPETSNDYLAKIDHTFSDRDTLSARYMFHKIQTFNTKPVIGLGAVTHFPIKAQNVALSETHIFSNSAVLSMRASWNRQTLDELYTEQNGSGLNVRSALSMQIPSDIGPNSKNNQYPSFSIAGYSSVGNWGDTPLYQPDENYQLGGDLAVIRGAHALKFGAELYRYRSVRFQTNGSNGSMDFTSSNPAGSGNALADFLLGLPADSGIGLRPLYVDLRRSSAQLYMVDKWSVTRKLMLNLGLRYEMNTPANEHGGFIPRFIWDSPGFFETLRPGEALFAVSHKTFAPRFGLTYSLPKDTVIRASYGIFYSASPLLAMTNRASNPPFLSSYGFNSSPEAPLHLDDPFPLSLATAGGIPSPSAYQFARGTPYVGEWLLDLQHGFGKNMVLDLAYSGNLGLKEGRSVPLNMPLIPGPGDLQDRRPLTNWGGVDYLQFDSNSNYEALQARLEKHFSSGFYLLAAYTWSKNLSFSDHDFCCGSVVRTDNLNLDWGPSQMDMEHVFHVSYVYDLPFGRNRRFATSSNRLLDVAIGGWQLSGVTGFQSGYAFTVWSQALGANTGLGTRPIRICNGSLGGAATINRWFDASCFVDPPLYTYGNSGSNILRGPGFQDWDIGLMKSFTTFREQRLQFRAEAFNAFNNVNYGLPNSTTGLPDTGVISSAGPARVIQFGLKYTF
jgi:hypothetical protein